MGWVNTRTYLQSSSDLVALLVLDHQAQMHNLITHAAYQARVGEHYDTAMNRALGRPKGMISSSTRNRIQSAGEKLLEYLLFSGEASLPGPSVPQRSPKTLKPGGPRDSKGRSLRKFDLNHRLFRYPCSFLIYSDSIDALPSRMLDYLANRLNEILTGEDESDEFAHLSTSDRRAILEILRETKPQLLAGAR